MQMQDKHAIITSRSTGIGAKNTRESAALGAKAAIIGRTETSLQEVAAHTTVNRKTDHSAEDTAKLLTKNNPKARFMQLSKVASATIWLCSDGATSVNRHALSVAKGEI